MLNEAEMLKYFSDLSYPLEELDKQIKLIESLVLKNYEVTKGIKPTEFRQYNLQEVVEAVKEHKTFILEGYTTSAFFSKEFSKKFRVSYKLLFYSEKELKELGEGPQNEGKMELLVKMKHLQNQLEELQKELDKDDKSFLVSI